jgi:hypothetical protein
LSGEAGRRESREKKGKQGEEEEEHMRNRAINNKREQKDNEGYAHGEEGG